MADGGQTIVVTSDTRADINRTRTEQVWEIVITSTFDADDTTNTTLALPLNGILRHITFYVPDTTNSVTKQLQINDNGDYNVFDTGELANVDAATTYNYEVDLPLSGTVDIVVGPSGATGDATTAFVVTLRGI